MNKKQILASLNMIANELDNTGLYKEANSLTYVMKRIANEQLNIEDPEFEKKNIIRGIPMNSIYQLIHQFAGILIETIGNRRIPHNVWNAVAEMVNTGSSSSQFDFEYNPNNPNQTSGKYNEKIRLALDKIEKLIEEFKKYELGAVPENDTAYERWRKRSQLLTASMIKAIMEVSKSYSGLTFEQASQGQYDNSKLKDTVDGLQTSEYNPEKN